MECTYDYDKEADAIYVHLGSKPYARGEDLDDTRRVDYASDGTAVGVEFLYVGQGVNLQGIPRADEVREILEYEQVRTYVLEQWHYSCSQWPSVLIEVRFDVQTPARGQSEPPTIAVGATA